MPAPTAPPFIIKEIKGLKKATAKMDRIAQNKMQAAINKSLRHATKATRTELKKAPLMALPKKNGLNKWAARTPTVRIKLQGRATGVTIKMQRTGHDLKALNRGRARHPVFGNRKVWVTQQVRSGWWDAATKKDGPRIVREVEKGIFDAIQGEWDKQ